jgi:peptidoglycan/LPS O-acetylase OafA/YrhL
MDQRLLGVTLPAGREFGLDFLRAMAIIQVVLGHGVWDLIAVLPVDMATLPLLNGGVTLFFVLSGFLIGRILITELTGHPPLLGQLRRFWVRRWFRTLPNYFFVLSLLTLWALAHNDFPADGWRYFVFLQNLMREHPRFFVEAWSLSIEEWFYLCLPIAFVGLGMIIGTRREAWLLLVLVVLAGSILIRYAYFRELDSTSLRTWDLNIRKNIVTRMDSLALGVLAAYLSLYYPGAWRRLRWPSLLAACILYAIYNTSAANPAALLRSHPLYYSVFSFNVLSLAGALTLPAMSLWRLQRGLFFRWITLISLISYSMYLLHYSLIRRVVLEELFATLPAMSPALYHGLIYVSYWVLTILLSVLLYRYFEVPTTRLRERFP